MKLKKYQIIILASALKAKINAGIGESSPTTNAVVTEVLVNVWEYLCNLLIRAEARNLAQSHEIRVRLSQAQIDYIVNELNSQEVSNFLFKYCSSEYRQEVTSKLFKTPVNNEFLNQNF